MIRLPTSLLTLGRRDLLEYEERRQQRELETVKRQFAHFEIGAIDGSNFGRSTKIQTSSDESFQAPETFKGGLLRSPNDAALVHSLAGGDYGEPQYVRFADLPSSQDQSPVISQAASPENVSQVSLEVQQSSVPPRDGSQCSGFIESPQRSSPSGRCFPFGWKLGLMVFQLQKTCLHHRTYPPTIE
jgi:hypothetical protein